MLLVILFAAFMQIIILAAGKGSRLVPFTDTTPKPLITVSDIPLLEYSLKQVDPIATRIVIVTNYLEGQIHNCVSKHRLLNIITCVTQPVRNGTGGAFATALPRIDSTKPVLILNGDDIYFMGEGETCKKSYEIGGFVVVLTHER